MSEAGERLRDLVMDLAELCVAPVWVAIGRESHPSTVDDNGTVTFVDTGQRKIFVTAQHVIAKFRNIRVTNPDAGLAINLGSGVSAFLQEFEVLDEDPDVDLAVVSFPSLYDWPCNLKKYFPVRTWPIPAPRRGDAVTIVGFPGAYRRVIDDIGQFSPAGIGMVVSNNPGRHVVLADESNSLRTITAEGERLGASSVGGFSGSAGFFFRDGYFHLAGFVYEGVPGFLFLATGARLRVDGTIAAIP